ncbi:MAG: helicase-related protein [Dehalogenimonas sp.]
MTPQNLFLTNDENKLLIDRLNQLIGHSRELKFLVGFFYFSGLQEIYRALKANPEVTIKILVGLNVDKHNFGIIEYGDARKLDGREHWQNFKFSVLNAFDNDEFDSSEFHEQVRFFLEAIAEDRLIIRKTREPNHAKLYLFGIRPADQDLLKSAIITGSSNLTRAGLSRQNEFNVEIKDYGYDEAEAFFDELWTKAVRITEDDVTKILLIKLITEKTQVAQITPYEAYVFLLKMYLEIQEQKTIDGYLIKLLEDSGYKTYSYQTDAVAQALQIIEDQQGVIISDVVGLGKSIIAGLTAVGLCGKRGLIICPPGLIGGIDTHGNRSGWVKYKNDFGLHSWEICSSGDLEKAFNLVQQHDGFDTVIIDEVHRFRNEDTKDYAQLADICRGRRVILLSATPFNNTPADIFALLKLFVVPGRSTLSIDGNLTAEFRSFNALFTKLSNIKKNYRSPSPRNRQRALAQYEELFGPGDVDIATVDARTRELSLRIKNTIAPVTIRRNRIDLKQDPEYSKEMIELPEVQDPRECFFALTHEQSDFYDRVITEYFGENGRFTGAIYQPFTYEIGLGTDPDKLDEEGNRQAQAQTNLYDFMRRLLVKRFESSFGAFRDSIHNFRGIALKAQEFIKNNGKFILDRKLLNRIYALDGDEVAEALAEFEAKLDEKINPKLDKVYIIADFVDRERFLADIQGDVNLLNCVLEELDRLKLTENDPKMARLAKDIECISALRDKQGEPVRKVVIFSEYIDTVAYVEEYLRPIYGDRLIAVKGDYGRGKATEILANFDTTYTGKHRNDIEILLTTDKMSEGFNLNRAGAVINYDIPWNPTRVIQRVGRINRISKKVFDKLYIYNFFPTLQGAAVVRSRQIATQKMFLIHNALGEDAKIFEADEEPTASELFRRVQLNPESGEEESFNTTLRRLYKNVDDTVKEKVADFPFRLKVSKRAEEFNQTVFFRRGNGLFVRQLMSGDDKPQQLSFQEALPFIQCTPEEPALAPGVFDWDTYRTLKEYRAQATGAAALKSFEQKAFNNLKFILADRSGDYEGLIPFITNLIEDISDFRTLPDFTLRELASLDATAASKRKNTIDRLHELRHKLGENYLDEIKQRASMTGKTVIVAIQNTPEASTYEQGAPAEGNR